MKKDREYHRNHPDKRRRIRDMFEYNRVYHQRHREEIIEKKRQWRLRNPDKMREIWRRKNWKRRNFVCRILNDWFEGSNLHHMGGDLAIYIPASLHESIKHSLKTGKNMGRINSFALEWWRKKERIPKVRIDPTDPRNNSLLLPHTVEV